MALAADFSLGLLEKRFSLEGKVKKQRGWGFTAGIAAMVVIAARKPRDLARAAGARQKRSWFSSRSGQRGFYRIDSAGGDCVSVFGSSRRYR